MVVNVDSLLQHLRKTGWEYFITWSHHLFNNGYYWEAHRTFRWLLEVLPLSKAKDLLGGHLDAARHMQTRNEALEIAISASFQVYMQHLGGSRDLDGSKWNDLVTQMVFGHFSGHGRKQSLFESDEWVLKQLQKSINCLLPLVQNQENEAVSSNSFTHKTQSSINLTEVSNPSRHTINATFRTAVKDGDVPPLESLLFEGADVESEDSFQQRPLHLAAANGHIEIVQKLIIHRSVKIESEDWFQQKPIYLAAAGGHYSVVQQLLDNIPPRFNRLHRDVTFFERQRVANRR